MNEYRVARAWKDAASPRSSAGTNEIMKELIGRDLGLQGATMPLPVAVITGAANGIGLETATRRLIRTHQVRC